MKSLSVLSAAKAVILARLFGVRTPLAVTWQVTSRCNLRCSYCGVWNNPFPELSTNEINDILGKLHERGCQYVSFTGGDPLIREDIGKIIQFALSKGFYVSLSSNGYLVPEKIEQLKGINDLKMSFDGPEEVHDKIRGQGSYRKLMDAVECCRLHGICPSMQCVLSKDNLDMIATILKIATHLGFKVMFQPATETMLWSEGVNGEAPPAEEYRTAVDRLIRLKKEGAPVRNSFAGLRHLRSWPDERPIYCSAGLLSFDLLPDGSPISCFRCNKLVPAGDCQDIIADLYNVTKAPSCRQCWCGGLVEFNLMASFHVEALINFFRKF